MRSISQREAKLLVRDYLRETGRKGLSSFMNDLNKYFGYEVCDKRTLEKWLEKQERHLQERNWEHLMKFICSEKFYSIVPYLNPQGGNNRVIVVGDGLAALFGINKAADGTVRLPSLVNQEGMEAIKLLDGYWNAVFNNLKDIDELLAGPLHMLCKIEPIPEKRYAKLAYLALSKNKQVSTTGIVLYINSFDLPEYDFYHTFIVQLWRRKDPESTSLLRCNLTYFSLADGQPKLAISQKINDYIYKEVEEVSSNEPLNEKVILLSRIDDPVQEAQNIIDSMIEDVLPHGVA